MTSRLRISLPRPRAIALAALAAWGPLHAQTVPLNTWFSATYGDHHTTSSPAWAGRPGEVRPVGGGSGYVKVREEGRVYDPGRPQPAGTVPLYSFFHEGRNDNFLTSDPAWTSVTARDGYTRVRLEGYVHARPVAGSVPLRSFWSAFREDNFVSTDPRLAAALGATLDEPTMSVEGGRYVHYRVEGYMLPPAGTPPARGRLSGLVDMHAHLMSHLGFGRKIIHGAPDVGSIVPAGTRDCNPTDRRSRSMAEALGHDNSTHGGHGVFDNPCGDHIRNELIELLERENGAHSAHGADKRGFPSFLHWPRHDDITHQQMWVDWIRRSHANGLRVMVTLATNSRALGTLLRGNPPFDDKATADVQVAETMAFVDRHRDFMEIARSAADLRRIVAAGRLAVVLGAELDDLGNFQAAPLEALTRASIEAEVRRLHGLGVRYVFPLHLTDNRFGGTATYEPFFNALTRMQSGDWWQMECSPTVGWRYGFDGDLRWALAHVAGLGSPAVPDCPDGQGHRNAHGLTAEGRSLVDMLMRNGMLIDIDHMSERTADDVLAQARDFPSGWGYPLVSGHNGPRGAGGTERQLRPDQLDAIRDRGGMLGLGWAHQTAADFHGHLRAARARMGPGRVAFGTDINGFSPQPGPRADSRVNMRWTTAGRTWDYNRDGVANYGMLAEFVQDLRDVDAAAPAAMRVPINTLHGAAESFARTWERAELSARSALAPDTAPRPEEEVVLTPAPTPWMCPTAVLSGDREFDGHGPEVWASAQLELSPAGSLEAVVSFRAKETTYDWSETAGAWRVPISGPGVRVQQVLSDMGSQTHAVAASAGFQIIGPGGNPNIVSTPPVTGGSLVRGFEIVGDTGGPDISDDGNCHDDTRLRVVFNPIRVQLMR